MRGEIYVRRRYGFTLIELLVANAIIAVLIGLWQYTPIADSTPNYPMSSVHFPSNALGDTPRLLAVLCTRAGGEVINTSGF